MRRSLKRKVKKSFISFKNKYLCTMSGVIMIMFQEDVLLHFWVIFLEPDFWFGPTSGSGPKNQKWAQTRSGPKPEVELKTWIWDQIGIHAYFLIRKWGQIIKKKTILFVSSRPFLLSTFLFFCYLPTLFCCLPQLPRTTDARRGICLHCSAENPLPLPNV